jgi:hypothetical protein
VETNSSVLPYLSSHNPLPPCWARQRTISHKEARVCITLPHLCPSREVPFLLGLEAGGLSAGEPPEDKGQERGLLVVVAGPPPRWPSLEFSLLQ